MLRRGRHRAWSARPRHPLVVAPVATDQYEMAAQIEHAGAGRACATEPLFAAAVRESFQEVSANPAYTAAAARLREQILSMPTPADLLGRLEGRGVTRIASLLTSRWLTPPARSMEHRSNHE